MIEKLYIKNYLIIKESEIRFSKGLNILTGETGAGKTIILDALALILGERADYSLLRKDSDKLIVEGWFHFSGNKEIENFLKEIDIEKNDSGFLIIRRELLKKGISRNFINDTPVNISDLKKLGDLIIDIHSQNEHQSLLKKEVHLDILDKFISKTTLLSEYKESFRRLSDLIKKYNGLKEKKNELQEKRAFLDFQLKEINNLNPSPDEDGVLETELKKFENVEDISLAVNNAVIALYEGEANALSLIAASLKELNKISGFEPGINKVIEDLENAKVLIKESSESMISMQGEINFDPVRIEEIRMRLSDINFLKKKYNLKLNELIEKGKELTEELNFAENFDNELENLKRSIEKNKTDALDKAAALSSERKKSAKLLGKKINEILNEVGLESAEFKVDFNFNSGNEEDELSIKREKDTLKLSSTGIDDAEFMIKANKGSEFSSLRRSASGGEISRIMLAIKTALSEKDNVPILVFDEIDSGISGRIAQKVGKIMKKLSETHQMICITHLPQIAAMSSRHFLVNKIEMKNDTIAEIKELNEEEKVLEVAKLLSGEKLTDAATKGAIELMKS